MATSVKQKIRTLGEQHLVMIKYSTSIAIEQTEPHALKIFLSLHVGASYILLLGCLRFVLVNRFWKKLKPFPSEYLEMSGKGFTCSETYCNLSNEEWLWSK